MKLPSALERLIQELQKLPGIGRKSSERIAFYLITSKTVDANALAQAILQVKQKIHFCPQCFNITDKDLCAICSNSERDRSHLCIVEQVVDLIALEKSGAYNGLYHVLRGRLSPLEGITDADLTIRELEQRLKNNTDIEEIIIATTTGLEGEATATYLT
ncbi:MAG: recombination mediator RecR, partial [Candidatus Sumerlaeia bacterium]|nr:recombination mediator RecR [Candidatus Sumerlaeia bacterium]